MNKKLLELLDKINAKKDKVKSLAEEGKLEEAKKAKDELKDLQTQFDLLKDLDDEKVKDQEDKKTAEEPKDAVKEFAAAARRGFKPQDVMKEGTPADGGYTVPVDIQTQINTYRESKFSLLQLVRREAVKTNKGERTFKKRSQQTGFALVGEGGKIGAKATPQFERLTYEIKKYAGYFPVTNELLADSDANITNTLIQWIGDESRVTANNLIMEKINTKKAEDLKGLDGIKKALNVTLGSAFKLTSVIVTNDDGLQWLDTLKDKQDRYLLAPNPAAPMQMQLAVGASYVPVKVVPNADLPNGAEYAKTTDTDIKAGKKYYTLSDETYTEVETPVKANIANYYEVSKVHIPMIIGDLAEAITYFDRQSMSIMVSNIASIGTLNAFEEDLTIYRAIEREDVVLRDEKAFVNGYIAV